MKGAPEGFMHVFTRAATAALLAILLGSPASASTKGGPRPHRTVHPAAPSLDLYSRRARRRAALILQLELLELRKARLERIREVIKRRLPVETLLRPDPT